MRYEEHCAISKQKFGSDYSYVHKWLDAYARIYGEDHRKFRHNTEGIESVLNQWGKTAAEAAKLHILQDIGEVISKHEWTLREELERKIYHKRQND